MPRERTAVERFVLVRSLPPLPCCVAIKHTIFTFTLIKIQHVVCNVEAPMSPAGGTSDAYIGPCMGIFTLPCQSSTTVFLFSPQNMPPYKPDSLRYRCIGVEGRQSGGVIPFQPKRHPPRKCMISNNHSPNLNPSPHPNEDI